VPILSESAKIVDKELSEEEWKSISTGMVLTSDGCQRYYRNGGKSREVCVGPAITLQLVIMR
jgi:hypothetical protein